MLSPPTLPPELASVVEQVRAWAGPDRPQPASAEERAVWLAGLRQLADAAEAAFLGVLGDFDTGGDGFVLHGASSTASWLRGALHLAPGDAATKVRTARAARGLLAAPVAALAAGEVTWDQVSAIERTTHRLPSQPTPTGTSPATTINQAIAPFLVPAGKHDTRTAAQRRADALVDLAVAAVAADAVPELSGAPANLNVVIPLASLTGDSLDPAMLPDHPGSTALLPPAAAKRLSCGALLTGIWLNHTSPLRLGRTQRLFTPGHRRAIALRDGGCRFPTCPRPARYTDAHHLHPWLDGGHTDLTNGLLLCRWHHRLVHEGGWNVTLDVPSQGTNARLWFHPPNGRPPLPSDPRGP